MSNNWTIFLTFSVFVIIPIITTTLKIIEEKRYTKQVKINMLAKDERRAKERQLENIYPKWNCPNCGDWFHMPYKYCRCDK